jgi:predicted kinase
MNSPVLFLMLGYPGSGKTTASRFIHDLTGAEHLWADKIRNERYPHPTHSHHENIELYDYLNQITDGLLAGGKSVIFDTGFNFYKDREHLRKIAKKHDTNVLLVWVQTDKEVARERATHEDHAARNTYPHAMPEERFERISHDFEPPQQNEAYIALDGTKITREYIEDNLKEILT